MEKRVYEENPLSFEECASVGVGTTIMRFNVTETEEGFECDEVEFNHKEPLTESDYSRLVAFLVREKYTSDDVEAIQQNYAESKTAKHKAEFAELKEWRAAAKSMAREVLGIEV